MKAYELLIKYFPIVKWGPQYKLSYLKNDIIAGLTVGATLIPQGLAYGSLAGLYPVYGLFAGLWGPFIYFFLGTSKDISLGPTAILSLLIAHYSQLSYVPKDPSYAILLAFLSGIIQLALGLFKLGFIANYMSPTVVSGFTSSAAITIAWGQMKSLLGLNHIRSNFILSIYDVFRNIQSSNISDLSLGFGCFTVLLFFKILINYIPSVVTAEQSRLEQIVYRCMLFICIGANIFVIILASVIGHLLDVYDMGDLSYPDHISSGLPEFGWPKFQISNGTYTVKTTSEIFMDIGTGIPIITLIALVEAMAIGKSFARRNSYKIRSSQEFIAIGLTNIVGSLFQAFPSTGSFSRTALNSQCSSKSPLSGVFTGTLVILSLLFLRPYFSYIPTSTLAAIIIVAVMFMTDFRYLIRIWRLNKYDFATWIFTFILSIVLGVEYGVLSGIGFSFLPIILNASQPKFEVHQCSSTFLGSNLWFPFCSRLVAMVEQTDTYDQMYSILNLTGVYRIDGAIINTIHDIGMDYQKRKKILIVISDNAFIRQILSEGNDEYSGLHCFSSTHEAQLFYQAQSNTSRDRIGEVVSLIPIH